MLVGAIINLSVSPAVAGQDAARIGTAIGFVFLALGVQIFCYSSLVFMAWQFMIGSVFLSVGLYLRSLSALLRLIHEDSNLEMAANIDIAVIPFFVIALALMGMRSFFNMRRPWLCPTNFSFFGTVMFGLGEVIGGSILSLAPYLTENPSWLFMIDSLTRGAMFVATIFLLLDAAFVSLHLQQTVEYSYPAMTMIVTNMNGAFSCQLLAIIHVVGGIVGFVWHSVASESAFEFDVALGFFLAFGLVILVLMSLFTAHREATCGHVYQVTGCTLFAASYTLRACGEILNEGIFSIASCAIGLGGSLAFGCLVLNLPRVRGGIVRLCEPSSYIRLLHPGNYFLLSNVLLAFAFLLWTFQYDAFGYIALLTAGLLLLFHLSMTVHAHQITHLADQGGKNKNFPASVSEETTHDSSTSTEGMASDVEKHFDVLICGGGPTGLLLASILDNLPDRNVNEAIPGPPDASPARGR